MVSGVYEALAREIDHITTSSYPSQLRTLYNLVQQCSDVDISQWAASKPCAVAILASCLIDGLRQWSFVLNVITKFAFNKPCRDTFLRQEPTLLHSVVTQAVKRGETKCAYVKASVAFLSSPLPDHVVLPAEVQTLVVQLVEEAAKRPSVASIEPVYLLLTGTGDLLIGILSNETLIRFEEHLLNILRGFSGNPDRCLSLYCLSIMNVVCSSKEADFHLTTRSYTTDDFLVSTPTSSKWKFEAMQQFLTGSKAHRSIQLVVLLVLWASSKSSSEEPTAEKVRSLILANEVIIAIPPDVRKNWCGANAITIRKLQEKLSAEGQDVTTKTLALRFFGKLCELDSLPHAVLESIKLTFLEPKSIQLMHMLCPRLEDRELLTSVLARAPIGMLLKNAVDFTIRAESPELAAGLDAIARVVHDAGVIVEAQGPAGHRIHATVNEAALAQSVQHLQDVLRSPSEHNAELYMSGLCPKALHRMRSNLAHQISDLLLRVCHSSFETPHSISLVLNLHASSTRGDSQCAHERPSWHDRVAFRWSEGEDVVEQIDWREAIKTHIKARALEEQDVITRVFAKACASLEARCENVERPLCEERDKRRAAEQHNEDLTKTLSDMEAHNLDYSSKVHGLEEERDQYIHDLEASRNENGELLERIINLEQKVREAQAQGERQRAEIEHEKQMNELDKDAALARKEEELEDLQEQLESTIQDTVVKNQEISALQGDLATARDKCDCWEEEVASKDARLHEMQNSLRDLERTREELQISNTGLADELKSAKAVSADQSQSLAGLERQLQAAQAGHEQTKASLSHETEKAEVSRLRLQEQLSRASDQAQEQKWARERVETQHAMLQQTLQETQARLTSDLEARNTRVMELKKKISHLQRQCEQKDQQITEAEAMRTNLMTAMGLSSNNDQERQANLPHRSRKSGLAPMPTWEDATPPDPECGDAIDVEDTPLPQHGNEAANTSFESQGPTPKRPRPGKSSAMPASNVKPKTRASLGAVAATRPQSGKGMQNILKRQTLGVVSENVVGRGIVFQTPAKEKQVEGDDELTFDGSELFEGTQGAKMAELQGEYDDERDGDFLL